MEKNKFIAIVLAFMLPLLSCYSQSNNKKVDKTLSNQQDTSKKDEANKANSAAVSSFIGKLMSNKEDTSKKVEGIHANPAAVEKNNAITVSSNGKAYRSCPDNHHPHQIDLGLPSGTKWACCDVGANTPEDCGGYGYYAWGETKKKTAFNWNTYIHSDGSKETCHNLGRDIAGTKYDVAHVKWGGGWHVPTLTQFKELINNCTYEWTMVNGVKGGKFTGPNGGSIFLPAAGRCWGNDLRNYGSYGYYWSSTRHPSSSNYAYYLYFNLGGANTRNIGRDCGQSVRPVVRN